MTLLPEVVYPAEIVDGVVKETLAGRHVLLLTFRITQGKYEGRTVEGRWYVPFGEEQDYFFRAARTTAVRNVPINPICVPFKELLQSLPALVASAGVLDPASVRGKAVNIRVYHKLNGAMQTVERVKDVTEAEAVPDDQIDGARFKQVEAKAQPAYEEAEPIDSKRFAPAEPLINATAEDPRKAELV